MGPFCEEKYNMLDIFLCDGTVLNRCSALLSIPEAALGTDHYLVKMVLAFDIPIDNRKAAKKINLEALLEAKCNSEFAAIFAKP